MSEYIEENETSEEAIEQIETTDEPQVEGDAVQSGEHNDEDVNDEDVDVVSIGDEVIEEPVKAPSWVKELRKSQRELARENRELKAKLESGNITAKPAEIVLGKKPTLESVDYDSDAYEKELESWYDRKRQVEAQNEAAKAEQAAAQNAWQEKLNHYNKMKTSLKVHDYDEAEHTASEVFNTTQQGIMLQGSDNPALVIYALGKNTKKAAELAAITDPVKFAFAIAKLEGQLKVTNKKPAPPPEKTVRGSGSISGTVDSTLDRLREEASKTGDFTKVVRYKAEQKRK